MPKGPRQRDDGTGIRPNLYFTSKSVVMPSAASSGISMSKASSRAITSSTVSRESAPRSFWKLDSGFTSPASTLSCSATMERTFSRIASWEHSSREILNLKQISYHIRILVFCKTIQCFHFSVDRWISFTPVVSVAQSQVESQVRHRSVSSPLSFSVCRSADLDLLPCVGRRIEFAEKNSNY